MKEAEFTALYRAEHERQVRRAYLLLGDGEDANDVVHEAMVSLYRQWDTVLNPGGYLNRAVLNGCRDHGRRRTVAVRAALRLAPGTGHDHDGDSLADVLATLPFPHRAAIVLRFYAGFTTAEIAEVLGCARGSVGPWIDRGLTAMRKVL